ncbi:Imidazolonepropionase, putative [Perkinsus marinus ATCC 50983]|uniref:Probable imidazolonepropionase n=1 Tax=Perkinsus marinus (strain ATCC 50983 / TXsc) TaxID=423536 RepID=C5L6P0_PERM5|nr:Imidazolonepropionase, putative [Perkinsus marinus ATCC 50983]EER07602.1 Imidazolonepropionase, putative [Perkinsus marinus ATCC 50983]|eukprot:XP_002775786.1 Imidazolonepropionase, putative [Perkinsus marinus ATCC 50983]
MSSLLVRNITTLYTCNGVDGGLGCINNATVAFKGDKVVYIGNDNNEDYDYDIVLSGEGLVAIPGMVDCHTHTVWAGSRAKEFSNRLNGATYIDILQQGGGILSTVRDTRNATLQELTTLCNKRLITMLNNGVTTCEIKSGYGLCVNTERDMLIAAKQATGLVVGDGGVGGQQCYTPRVTTTFLGAHTIPSEYKDRRYAYIRQVVEDQLPVCAPLADSIDIFCDKGAFTLQEADTILRCGKDKYGLSVKAHAEQIEHTGCSKLVASLGGISADHLERIDNEGCEALSKANVVAVMLPAAQLYLKDITPPIDLLRHNNVTMAIGSDLNPGTSPIHDLLTTATLACIVQGVTIPEALLGITRHAGQALGISKAGWAVIKDGRIVYNNGI